jgi:hypothetical protein
MIFSADAFTPMPFSLIRHAASAIDIISLFLHYFSDIRYFISPPLLSVLRAMMLLMPLLLST